MRNLFAAFILTLVALPASAQGPTTGTPPFGSFSGGPDVVDLANLNVHLGIPVLHKPGRGTPFAYDLNYDSSVWMPVNSGGTKSWQPASGAWGWQGITPTGNAYITYTLAYNSGACGNQGGSSYQMWNYASFFYYDELGVPHPVNAVGGMYVIVSGGTQNCPANGPTPASTPWSGLATDGSGYTLNITPGAGYVSGSVVAPNGSTIYPPILANPSNQWGTYASTDRNGNQITSNSGVFTDTLGATALTIAGQPPSNTTFTYTAPSGATAAYTSKYTTFTVRTNFGCSGVNAVSEYGSNGTTTASLVSEIDLPDYNSTSNPNSRYVFTYETTPGDTHTPHHVTGRIASVTLPTGGTISYVYTGGSNGITCADGSTAGLRRTTPDTGANYWQYDRAAGTGAAYTTTVTDPQGNKTVVQFQGIYETQRDFYQGAVSPSNLLQTVQTCYNGNATSCTSTAITLPINQRKIITLLSGGLQSEHDDFWNTYGAPTESDDYDYGTGAHGPLLKQTLATYTTMGNINAFRQTLTVKDGNGNTVSKINNNYDETSVTSTSGTPQHINPTTARGNLTSTNIYVNATTFLTKTATYYDTGMMKNSTDVNSGVTTYNYASVAASCGNSFATSINEAVSGLSTSQTWNCTGGVQLTSTDENNQTTTTTYTDPYFWRPASIADPTGATTNFCYGLMSSGSCSVNPNQTESTLTFNSGNSAADTLTTLDGLGRAHVQQTRQAPGSSSFDSVETDFDSVGRVNRVTLPYSASAGQTNSTIASTSTTYDALSRPLTVTDGGGRTITYSYGTVGSQKNDTLVTQGPAPTGENTKSRQLETDGLGRLTSVCEITAGTTVWPGGTCAQSSNQTGYWIKYTYDPSGNLLTVTQNAQAASNHQTRTFVYDWRNRMLSETVPEIGASGNGTANYTYDSDATCGTYKGDLVKKVDAAGNTFCSTYDLLHRQLTTTYPSGPYSSVTPQKHFVYDAAVVNSQSMTYVQGRLAEAYTCFSPCTSKSTDIGLSYTVRGEISDEYESTPNSGSFYHISQSYWDNSNPNRLSGNVGLPTTITFGADGEGRTNTVSATAGQNPISATTYSTAGLVSSLSLGSGSGDADSYTYDPNTNRMTQYKFTVNSVSLTSNLGWNANGTMQTQNITDGFNSADTQNCSYLYDDASRVTSANCGTAAAQTFSFDPFGNINKAGSPYSFNANYNASTNRISTVGGTSATYDSNGNATNDTFHTFTWDADGHPITVDSGQSDAVSLTYDALGRMAEQNRAGVFSQFAYSPTGHKLAMMHGSTLMKAMVPLPGKAFAIYNSGGLLYYAHPDLLGSIRLATTPARATYFDTAYAPFGETYASTGTFDPAYTGQMGDVSHRQDTVGGLYDFPAREYSTQGRWPSPDPAGTSSTCLKDPQSQNRYAYVRNNPITRIDPNGMDSSCNPDDPLCGDPCVIDPFLCFPPPPNPPTSGGGGSNGGGGGEGPKPRTFPWALFSSLGDDKPKCEVTMYKPGHPAVSKYDACADMGKQLIWVADCTEGSDKACCRRKLNDDTQYKTPCESYRGQYFLRETAQLLSGWCCREK